MNDVTRFADGLENANMIPDAEFMDEMREVLDRKQPGTSHPRGQLKEVGATNKIKDKLGERNAIAVLKRKFPGAGVVEVVNRGRHGAPVLDALLELPNGDFVVIEAKWSDKGKPTLGSIKKKIWINTGAGWKESEATRKVKQMSPEWVEDKIHELRRRGGTKFKRLAAKLERAFHAGKILPIIVTTDDVGEVRKIKNLLETDEWADFRKLREEREALEKKRGTSKGGGGKSKATNRNSAGTKTVTKKPATADLDVPELQSKSSKTLTRSKRLASKPKLGLGANLMVGVASEILLSKLEGKLQKENDRGIEREYGSHVYEAVLKKWVDLTVSQAKKGYLQERQELQSKSVYIHHRYTVYMERQAKGFADGTIFVIRLLTFQSSDFYEVYHSLKAKPEIQWLIGEPKSVVKVARRRKAKEIKEDDILAYDYSQYILVWDPTVFKLSKILQAGRKKLGQTAKQVFDAAWLKKEEYWLVIIRDDIYDMINNYQFQEALDFIEDKKNIPDNRRGELEPLITLLNSAELYITMAAVFGTHQHRALLVMYLGKNPFPNRKKVLDRKAKKEAAKRLEKLMGKRATFESGKPGRWY